MAFFVIVRKKCIFAARFDVTRLGGCIVKWNLKTNLVMSYLTAEKKQELFEQFGASKADTGSPESQIALFTYRINHLTEHMNGNRHDYGTQRALLRLVGKRRKSLDYLKKVDIERYRAIVKALNLRK